MTWALTVRAGARVRRERFETLGAALDALERQGRELESGAPGEAVEGRVRRFEASERVFARLEVAGPQRLLPSHRGGIDVHGDGSLQPFLGRARRTPLVPARRQTPYEALRSALEDAAG